MTSLYSEDNFSITHQGVQNSASSSLCHVLDVSHASRFLPALGLNTRSPFWDSFFLTPSLACLPDSICFSYNKCYLCCLLAVGFPLSFAPVICCCITNHPLLGGVNNSFFFFFLTLKCSHILWSIIWAGHIVGFTSESWCLGPQLGKLEHLNGWVLELPGCVFTHLSEYHPSVPLHHNISHKNVLYVIL